MGKKIQDVKELMEKGPFSLIVRYARQPIILLEYMCTRLYRDNPLYRLIGYKPQQEVVVLQDKELEVWENMSKRPIVKDREKILEIDMISRRFYEKTKIKFREIMNLESSDLKMSEFFIETLEEVNKLSQEVYWHFTFYTEECFQPSDETLMHQLQETRMFLHDLAFNHLFKIYEKLIYILIGEYKLPKEIVNSATTEEIIFLVTNPKKVLEYKEIENRSIAWVHLNGEFTTVTGEKVKEIRNHLVEQDPDKNLLEKSLSKGEILGDIGNKGIVNGEVCKILATDYTNTKKLAELSKKEKYILVIPMTSPELVKYFGNTAAFICDEGGITCHAAIIAREMGIPCIVNTKIATQILKDGDLVEVNANEGTVRIIEKTNSVAP